MKNAAVAVDDWKLPVFKRHLDAAGYAFTVHPGVTKGTLTLRVRYQWVAQLWPIIEAAIKECRDAP